MEFYLGSLFGFVLAILVVRLQDRRIDLDIEARLMALDAERLRRIFRRHATPCRHCDGRGHTGVDVDAAARDPEWSAELKAEG